MTKLETHLWNNSKDEQRVKGELTTTVGTRHWEADIEIEIDPGQSYVSAERIDIEIIADEIIDKLREVRPGGPAPDIEPLTEEDIYHGG